MPKGISTKGFTIVELLIVIVVIVILATIGIVAYNGIQDRANATAAQADLTNFKKKIELVRAESDDGLYPAVLTADMGFKFSKSIYRTGRNNIYYCLSPDRTQYAAGAILKKSDAAGFVMTSTSPIVENASVSGITVCGFVNPGSGWQLGYSWDGGGIWNAWVN